MVSRSQPHGHRPVSLADVARRAGVSAQTVSRVSTGYTGVSPDTRRRVLATMSELGYQPNSAARALKRGDFRTLGVVSACVSHAGDSRVIEAIATHATAEGYATILIPHPAPGRDAGRHGFSRLDELAVDGVVLLTEPRRLQRTDLTFPPTVPHVVAGGDIEDCHTSVGVDQADSVRRAVQHLLALGHPTAWHLSGPEGSTVAQHRADAWRAELRAAGRPVPPLLHGDWSARSGYAAGLEFAADPECSAVLAGNDQMALGVLRAFQQRGRAVPEQVSVVGFDDIADSASFQPPLTTVSQDFAEIGRLCVRELLSRIRGEAHGPGQILVPARLVVRSSTAAPPTGRRAVIASSA